MKSVTQRIPLAPVTQRLWLEWKRAPESSAYLVPYAFRLHPGVDRARLEAALRAAVEAHQALRSVIEEIDGRPVQTVGAAPRQILEVSDSWEWAVTRPFDLAHGPLFRFVLSGDVFVANASHLVLDGTGIELLLDEVGRRYAGEAVAPDGPGPAAWAEHERRYIDSPRYVTDLDYWVGLLDRTDFHVGLPGRRSVWQGEPDGIHHFSLPAPRLGVSPFLAMMAVLKALLHRYSGQETISLLYPTNLRGREFAGSFGSFVNTLISTASLSAETAFRQLCAMVHEQRQASRQHADAPLQDVVRALRRKHKVDSFELPNVTMALSSFHPRFALGDPVPLASVDAQADLLFMFQEAGDRIEVRLHYRSALFTEVFAEEIGRHFVRLAALAEAHPDQPIATLPMATAEEGRRIETEWNPPPAPFDGLQLLHEAVAARAARTPDAPAILTLDRVITYGEAQKLANRIGHRLRREGVRPNTLVAVMMEKGWEQAVACLGILNSGAAYLPINAAWPAERIDNVIEQGEVDVVLSQKRVLDRLGRKGLAVDVPETWQDEPDSPLPAVNGLDDICYVIFTSGSTGRPKGVVLSHGGVMNTIRDCNQRYGVTAADRTLQLSDLSFDLSVYDIFGMLSAGGAVVVPDEDHHLEPPHWIELVRRHRVSIWNSVPMYVDMWVQSGEPLPGLRLFMLSGDKIPVDLPQRVRALMPGVAMWSLGGATEGSIWSIWYEIGEVDPSWSTIPYGRAMTNQEMYVLDAGLNHCPAFMTGRVFIGGMGVARGYWRDQAKTDAAFRTHPVTGKRIYDTGDLGRWLPDGNIEFLGRADFQVKINGFRVELGEIEGALIALPGVKTAIVDAQDQPGGRGKCLVAYLAGEGVLEPEAMRAALQDRLPYYMIPRFFVRLDEVPLSGNGKVDRKALPRPDLEHMAPDHPYVAPRTATEATLASIWEKLLKHEPIGIHDNFFALGGDSLMTIQFVMLAREAGIEIGANALQGAPTIAELVQHLARTAGPAADAATGEVPLSPMQRYYLGWAHRFPNHFNVSAVFRCDLDAERLRAALQTVARHHDALRLRVSGGRMRYVDDPGEVPLVCETAAAAELPERIRHLQATLDLEHGPVLRAALFATEDGQRLVVICHHMVCDGVAWGFVVSDLQRAYQGLALPKPSGTFKAWTERLVRYATSPEAEAQLPFWQAQVGPSFPLDSPDEGALQSDLALLERELLGAPAAHLYERLAAALVEASGQPRLLVHLVGHGREPLFDDVDPTRVCGWFTTHTPLVLGGGLAEVTRQLHGMPQHGLAHGALRYYHPRGETLAGQDRVKVLYNFLGDTWDGIFDGPLLHRPEDALLWPPGHCAPGNLADFQLYLHAYVYKGALRVRFVYSRRNFRPETIERLAVDMRRSLQAHLDEPVSIAP
jgi:amino acid adenylation domain-containing protein